MAESFSLPTLQGTKVTASSIFPPPCSAGWVGALPTWGWGLRRGKEELQQHSSLGLVILQGKCFPHSCWSRGWRCVPEPLSSVFQEDKQASCLPLVSISLSPMGPPVRWQDCPRFLLSLAPPPPGPHLLHGFQGFSQNSGQLLTRGRDVMSVQEACQAHTDLLHWF